MKLTGKPRQRENGLVERLRRYLTNRRNAAIAYRKSKPEDEFEKLVNKLTNWQRCQWAKDGYKGLASNDRDTTKLKPYLQMSRRY